MNDETIGALGRWMKCGLAAAAFIALAGQAPAEDTGKRIVNADAEPGNWLSYGRTDSLRANPI